MSSRKPTENERLWQRAIIFKTSRNIHTHTHTHERWSYLLDGQFDPVNVIEVDEQRLWQWTDLAIEAKPRMVIDVTRYFALRKEDD